VKLKSGQPPARSSRLVDERCQATVSVAEEGTHLDAERLPKSKLVASTAHESFWLLEKPERQRVQMETHSSIELTASSILKTLPVV
jgi:hypothetical protein